MGYDERVPSLRIYLLKKRCVMRVGRAQSSGPLAHLNGINKLFKPTFEKLKWLTCPDAHLIPLRGL